MELSGISPSEQLCVSKCLQSVEQIMAQVVWMRGQTPLAQFLQLKRDVELRAVVLAAVVENSPDLP